MAESLSIMVAAKLLPLPNVHQDNQDLQLGIVLALNLLALLLKLVYYSLFHTWSALNIATVSQERSQPIITSNRDFFS